MRTILFFIYCVFNNHCYSQIQNYTPKVKLAIETYAFLKGQSSALKKVALEFPALKHDVAATEKSSAVLFGRAEQNIHSFLKAELNNSEFNRISEHIDTLLNEQLNNPIQKKEYAFDFLEKVRCRLRFSEDSIIEKAIISFAYHDAPHQEITDGHIKNYTTQGHPKAEKTALQLSIPKSWKAEEAESSETIQQFTSHDGRGHEKILIVLYDLPAEQHDIILDEKTISEMIPPETKLIRSEATAIDGKSGMLVEVEETLNSSDERMKIRIMQFMIVQNGKLLCLQGSIGPVAVTKNLDLQLKKYKPLFHLIATRAKIDN